MLQEERTVGQEIHKLHHMISRYLTMCVKEEGIDEITLMHGWIMKYLYENKEHDIFQKDIEKTFSIGRSTVTNIIQILEKKGYVRREFVEHDARLKKVILTEKGIKGSESIEKMIKKMDTSLEENINDQELDTFFCVSDKIMENLKNQRDCDGKGGIGCLRDSYVK